MINTAFNYVMGVGLVAVGISLAVVAHRRRQPKWCYALSVICTLLGVTEFIEIKLETFLWWRLPGWLLALKLFCVIGLIVLYFKIPEDTFAQDDQSIPSKPTDV